MSVMMVTLQAKPGCEAALERHMVSPHVHAFLARLPVVLAGEPHITALEVLAGFSR